MKPYIVVNFASSLDGRIAFEDGSQAKLSSEEDFRRVHFLRNSVDAIMVGIGTVLKDDPKLNVKEKYVENPRTPARVVVDSRLRLPVDAEMFSYPGKVYVASVVDGTHPKASVIKCREKDGKVDLTDLMEKLYEAGFRKILLEGGAGLITTMLNENLADEMHIYFAPVFMGDRCPAMYNGGSLKYDDVLKMKIDSVEPLGEGFLVHIKF